MPDDVQPTPASEAVTAATRFVQAEAQLVAGTVAKIDTQFEAVAARMMAVTGKVVFSGSGTSGYIARRAAHLFSVCGTPAMFLHPADALHGGVASLQAHDLLVVLSKGGRTYEVNELARLAKGSGIYVVALTSREDSEVAAIADRTVVLPADGFSDPGGLIAMGSTLAHSAWLDGLAYVLMRARGYDFEHVLHSHPGGAVGHVTDVPAPLDGLTLTPVDDREGH
jgi:arabinose-5-phosphate isomerase